MKQKIEKEIQVPGERGGASPTSCTGVFYYTNINYTVLVGGAYELYRGVLLY